MKKNMNVEKESLLASVKPSKAIIDMAVPATLALLAKAVYNIVDTAYIGMLNSDTALAAVGVTLPLLLIMVSIENIFAAGAGVLAGRQLGEHDKEGANRTVTTIVGFSMVVGIGLCIVGILFEDVLLRAFGASEAVLPQAKDYAFWMFIAALFNLPAQSLNCAARAESSVKISSVAVITGAVLNVILDPIFMFSWGLNMGVEGASLATTISQCVTFLILLIFYMGGFSVIKIKPKYFKLSAKFIWDVVSIGIPTAVIQICLVVATSLTNIAAKTLSDADLIIAAYGVVQRLILIGCYVIMGFMQGYQPVASYAFGPKNEERFNESAKFAFKGSLLLTIVVAVIYIALAKPLILLFNRNPLVVEYGKWLFLSLIRQCLFYVPFILSLPGIMGVKGIYFSQPAADILTIIVCIALIKPMKRDIIKNMKLDAKYN
nr:MATE family efflux transporter [uncultured Blautia sp.]